MSKATVIAQRLKADAEELTQILDTSTLDEEPKTPSAQTIATAKYQEKAGIIARSYKLKATTANAFKTACDSNGESQAAVLTRLMTNYISDKDESINSCWFCKLKARFLKKQRQTNMTAT